MYLSIFSSNEYFYFISFSLSFFFLYIDDIAGVAIEIYGL